MYRNWVAFVAVFALLVPGAGEARAWGTVHVGYTYVGPNGVYHADRTTGYTPFGVPGYPAPYHYPYGYNYGYRVPFTPLRPVVPVAPFVPLNPGAQRYYYGSGVYRRR